MPMHNALSADRSKELRNRHPLYRRLSGESVWLFLEELGLTEAQCEAFMEAFFQQMEATLAVMDILDRCPEYIGIIEGDPLEGCECAPQTGCRAGWPETGADHSLPPYAIGCPLRVRLAPVGERHGALQAQELPGDGQDAAPGRSRNMLCPALAAAPHERLACYLSLVAGSPADEKN